MPTHSQSGHIRVDAKVNQRLECGRVLHRGLRLGELFLRELRLLIVETEFEADTTRDTVQFEREITQELA